MTTTLPLSARLLHLAAREQAMAVLARRCAEDAAEFEMSVMERAHLEAAMSHESLAEAFIRCAAGQLAIEREWEA